MNIMGLIQYGAYSFGPGGHLENVQIDRLIHLFQQADGPPEPVLGGRSPVKVSCLDGIGPIVVKQYARGGLLRHLVKKSHLKWGKPRCQMEYELLEKVRSLGIRAPEPVVFAFKGGLVYRGWLVTKEIREHQTLAKLSTLDENRAMGAMQNLIGQISILINHRILHVDLHPGNVLVNAKNEVFLVDFDKGHEYAKDENHLRRRYLSRWERAVKKHRLPERLIEAMKAGLLGNL